MICTGPLWERPACRRKRPSCRHKLPLKHPALKTPQKLEGFLQYPLYAGTRRQKFASKERGKPVDRSQLFWEIGDGFICIEDSRDFYFSFHRLCDLLRACLALDLLFDAL